MYNIIKILFILIFTYNCSSLYVLNTSTTGINKEPKNQRPSKSIGSDYTINDVRLDIIEINKLNETQLKKYNDSNINEVKYSVQQFSNIYNYKYEYVLGTSDVITINLTDTDDLDGAYTIDPKGNIDLPFIGNVNVLNLTLDNAKEKIVSVLKKYYKNYDLQITIDEFNSSKAYILGAVQNQITINLNQKPIKLIDAAIQANYSPTSSGKNFGSKGLLRRDNEVYKIDLNSIFKSKNSKDNFYLKKDDVLFVDQNSDSIHIFGEVIKPGVYFPNLNYSLTELISSSGLNNLTANASRVYVIREDYNSFLKINIFKIDIRNPVSLVLGKKFILKPKDIVYIPPTKLVKWNRVISLLLPQTDLFKSYNPIINNGLRTYREP